MTNKQLAEEILQKVGGKKNINSYSHCSTRLRFDLKDKNSIDKAALERTDGILQGNGSCRANTGCNWFKCSICIR